jgi:copper(I)-binding protein
MKLLVLIFFTQFGFVHSKVNAPLKLENAQIRFVPKGRNISAAFVKIKNTTSNDIEIVDITSDRFAEIELHTHKIIDGVMKMRQVSSMLIKANSQRVLKSKSDHIMFFGLKKELKLGEKIPLKLIFKDKKSQVALFEVKK